MPIQYIRPSIPGELRDPFDCDEQAVKALVTAGAFVALADGRVEVIERDEAVHYIDRLQLAPTISRQRIADFFDETRTTAPGRRHRGFDHREPSPGRCSVTEHPRDSNC